MPSTTHIDPVAEILRYNAGRDPERLALKYRAIADNPFSFLRGTCHLFYQRLPKEEIILAAPSAWICGDLHLENFGSYKGDNRLVYFDMNDFDEALLAPCTMEIVRLLTSILVAAEVLGIARHDARVLCLRCLDAYAGALADGKARWVDRDTAEGPIAELFEALKTRKRQAYIDSRTVLVGGHRRLRTDNGKALPVSDQQRETISHWLSAYSAPLQNPYFFRPLDVARRIAGTGSLGLERYVILVEGKGGPDGHYLLDLKAANPSCLAPYVTCSQPTWASEAERVVTVQNRVQAISSAFLEAVLVKDKPFVLKGLQPSQDRVELRAVIKHTKKLERLMATFGEIAAWGHIRASGRQGAANADELETFGSERGALDALLELADHMARQNHGDWEAFAGQAENALASIQHPAESV